MNYLLNICLSIAIVILYLFYAVKNKNFLAFTLSAKYWISLFLGIYLGTLCGIFVSCIVISSRHRLGALSDLGNSVILAIILSFPSFVILSIVLSILFFIIISIIKDTFISTQLKIIPNHRHFYVNLFFMSFISFFLLFSIDEMALFGLVLMI